MAEKNQRDRPDEHQAPHMQRTQRLSPFRAAEALPAPTTTRRSRVGRPVEVPDAGRRSEAHGEVEPESDTRRGREEGPTVARVFDRALAVVAEHYRVPPFGPGPPRKWWVGTSDAPMVVWPERRQSSL